MVRIGNRSRSACTVRSCPARNSKKVLSQINEIRFKLLDFRLCYLNLQPSYLLPIDMCLANYAMFPKTNKRKKNKTYYLHQNSYPKLYILILNFSNNKIYHDFLKNHNHNGISD